VRRARTPLVALTDDDSWWAPGSLATAAAVPAASPRVGLLAARVLVGPELAAEPANAVMAASPLPSGGLPGPHVLGFLGELGRVIADGQITECGSRVRDDVLNDPTDPRPGAPSWA
jgi:hypothetical protein